MKFKFNLTSQKISYFILQLGFGVYMASKVVDMIKGVPTTDVDNIRTTIYLVGLCVVDCLKPVDKV